MVRADTGTASTWRTPLARAHLDKLVAPLSVAVSVLAGNLRQSEHRKPAKTSAGTLSLFSCSNAIVHHLQDV